jgi:1,4-alpha-glucan branching enzyme
MATVSEALDATPADKAMSLPEGTWGAGGDHRVWLGEHTWMFWNAAYRAEDRFVDLWHRADWARDERIREVLTEAGRQLLLLQASDWPFVVATQGAPDYGTRRFLEHAGRFDDLCLAVEDLLAGREPTPSARATLAYCRVADPVFPDLQLGWWA